MIKGEPVFQAGDTPTNGQSPQSSSGEKVLPVVLVDRVEYRDTGSGAEIYWTVKNASDQQVMLDKIILFGNTDRQQEYLRPGETYELLVYRGDKLRDDNYTKAEIWYKTDSGDYFSSRHMLEYRFDSDQAYELAHVKFLPPVKDI